MPVLQPANFFCTASGKFNKRIREVKILAPNNRELNLVKRKKLAGFPPHAGKFLLLHLILSF